MGTKPTDKICAFVNFFQSGKTHRGARDMSLWLEEETVQLFIGPCLSTFAIGLETSRIVEFRMIVADSSANDIPKIGAYLVSAALFPSVA